MTLVMATSLFLDWLFLTNCGEEPPTLVGDMWHEDNVAMDPFDYLASMAEYAQEELTAAPVPTDWDSDKEFDWPSIREAWSDLTD